MSLRFVKEYGGNLYLVFRVLVGLLFLQHGLQKFGFIGDGNAIELVSLLGLAGVIELATGVGLTLGLFTRILALLSACSMFVAYFLVHFSMDKLLPIFNKGELALLYLAAFLVLLAHGAGKWCLEKTLFGKEHF